MVIAFLLLSRVMVVMVIQSHFACVGVCFCMLLLSQSRFFFSFSFFSFCCLTLESSWFPDFLCADLSVIRCKVLTRCYRRGALATQSSCCWLMELCSWFPLCQRLVALVPAVHRRRSISLNWVLSHQLWTWHPWAHRSCFGLWLVEGSDLHCTSLRSWRGELPVI